MILLASIIGAAAGVFYTTQLNPLNNYYIFIAIFAMIGAAIADILLLILYEAYKFLETATSNLREPEKVKPSDEEFQ